MHVLQKLSPHLQCMVSCSDWKCKNALYNLKLGKTLSEAYQTKTCCEKRRTEVLCIAFISKELLHDFTHKLEVITTMHSLVNKQQQREVPLE